MRHEGIKGGGLVCALAALTGCALFQPPPPPVVAAPVERVDTAAVGQLLEMAASSGIVRQVVAHIAPGNLASSKVVSRLGFSVGDALVDPDGTTVVRWSRQVAPANGSS